MHKVFVYGTLKRGFPNASILEYCEFISNAVVRGLMRSLGPFPAVSLHGDNQIKGEIYAVDDATMAHLDRLEGVPSFYQRDKVETSAGPAWIYTIDDQKINQHPIIKGGNWLGSDELY